MKGYFLYINKEDPPYTHNLIKLSKESGIDELITEEQKYHLNILMPMNIEARYPDEKKAIMKTLNYEKSKFIYEKTEEIIKWIQKLIAQ